MNVDWLIYKHCRFFNGCVSYSIVLVVVATLTYMNQDRYIPVFDPEHDTFASVRSRSPILFNAICAIGYRVETSKHYLKDSQEPLLKDLKNPNHKYQKYYTQNSKSQATSLSKIKT